MKEIWKDIPGYEGLYQVSNFGRIKGFPRVFSYTNRYGKTTVTTTKKRILKATKTGQKWKQQNSYLSIVLRKNGEERRKYVHRIVAETFIPNPDNKPQVNHINGDKTDNRVENLEWDDQKHNLRHSYYNLNNTKGCFPAVKTFCIETRKEYPSTALAARENGLDRRMLTYAIKTGRKLGGFHWSKK